MIGASSVPKLTSISAGKVIRPASNATSITALTGTRLAFTLAQIAEPGIAPSRLKAKVIREALVRQATVQNSWPQAEMNTTIEWVVSPNACVKMTSDA